MVCFDEVTELFNRARAEMFLPPMDVRVEAWEGRVEVSVRGRVAQVRVPRRLLGDPESGPLLLWYFRHHLAHMHYCPYNLRTVQTLARAAYEEVRSWRHAHNAVRLFSDLQVDLLYLPLRYKRPPLHISDEFYSRPRGLDALRYAAYRHVYGDMLRRHRLDKDTLFYGSLLAEVILSSRPWVAKVKAVATVLRRLQDLGRVKELRKRAGSDVPLSEDLEIDFLREARRAMRGIRSEEEAREMFEHWLRGRVDVEELKRQFRELIEDLMDMFKDIRGLEGRRALNEARRRLLDPRFAREFERKYKELRLLYELITPDPLLAEYYDDYKWLTEVYIIYCRQFKGKDPEELERYVRAHFRKTLALIDRAIDLGKLRDDFPILALDEECLRRIEELEPDVEHRTIHIITLLRRTIVARREENPLFERLADKVECIVREWNERLIRAEEAYRQLSEVVAEYNRAMRKKRELGLTDVEFFSLLTLRDYVKLPEGRLLTDIREFLASVKDKLFEGWILQRTVVHEVEKALRKFIANRYGKLINREKRDELHEKIMGLLKKFLS